MNKACFARAESRLAQLSHRSVLSKLVGAVLAASAAMSVVAPARAAVVAAFDFSPIASGGNWGNSPLTPTATDPNESVVGLTRNWTTGSGTAAGNAWGGNNFAQSPNNTQTGAIAASNFATISLTASAGYDLSLSGVDAYNIRRSSTGPTAGLWQYKVDGGSYVDIGSSISWGSTTTSAGNAQSAIVLSGVAALQHVAPGTTVTLRVVTWGATSTGGTWYFNDPADTTANDLVINGTLTPVPEPAAVISLVACGAGMLTTRRMRGRGPSQN